jgi:hypothetical protein
VFQGTCLNLGNLACTPNRFLPCQCPVAHDFRSRRSNENGDRRTRSRWRDSFLRWSSWSIRPICTSLAASNIIQLDFTRSKPALDVLFFI